MARKTTISTTTRKGTTSTRKRGTPIPKSTVAGPREINEEMIARRAYEIYASGSGGSEEENWYRAERELRGQ